MRRVTQLFFTLALLSLSTRVAAQLEDPIMIIPIGENQTINCTNDPVNIGVIIGNWRPGFVYLWSSGHEDSVIAVKPNTTSTYVLTVSNDFENIHAVRTFTVTVENDPLLANDIMYHIDKFHCPGQTFVFNPEISGGYSPFTYSWSTGQSSKSIQVAPLATTSYQLTITDVCGTEEVVSADISIDERDPLVVPQLTEVSFNCDGVETKIYPKLTGLSGGVGYGYVYTFSNWNASNKAIVVEAHDKDTYEARVTDACKLDEVTTLIKLNQQPLEKPMLKDLTVCSGNPVNITGQSDIQLFYWDGSELKLNEELSFDKTQNINLKYIDECGIERGISRTVNVLQVNSEFDVSLSEEGKIAQLKVLIPDNYCDYTWTCQGNYLGQGFSQTIVAEEGQTQDVSLLVTNEIGCKSNRTKTVKFEQNIDAATAFTPNGDGKNDAFSIDMGEELQAFHIKIFDRWGQLVFESSDQYFAWDGGEQLNSQINTYAFKLVGVTVNGSIIEKSGTVTVVN